MVSFTLLDWLPAADGALLLAAKMPAKPPLAPEKLESESTSYVFVLSLGGLEERKKASSELILDTVSPARDFYIKIETRLIKYKLDKYTYPYFTKITC